MWRLGLSQAAICSGLPILPHHGHSANMGTEARDLHLREHDPCLRRERASGPTNSRRRSELWQRRFDDPIVLTDGFSKVRRPDARRAF